MTEKLCKRCGAAMAQGSPASVVHVNQKDWEYFRQSREHLLRILKDMQTPFWWCEACVERDGNSPTVPMDEAFARIRGCSVEEWRERVENRRRERTPDDEIIRVTVEEVRAALGDGEQ